MLPPRNDILAARYWLLEFVQFLTIAWEGVTAVVGKQKIDESKLVQSNTSNSLG